MRANSLRRHFLWRVDLETERVAIKRQRRRKIRNCYANVIELRLHERPFSGFSEPRAPSLEPRVPTLEPRAPAGDSTSDDIIDRRVRIDLARRDAIQQLLELTRL